jgi:uncharacterized protein
MPVEPEESERGKAPYWIALVAVLMGLAGGEIAGSLVEGIGGAFGSSTVDPPPAVNIIANFLLDGAFVVAALYVSFLRGWMGRAEFGYRRIRWRLAASAFVLAAIAYYVVTLLYSLVFSLHGTDKLPSDLGVLRSTWAAIAVSVFVCVSAPICEEFFFRGFLFGVLRRLNIRIGERQVGPWVAAAIVGVVFGAFHFDSAQPEFLIPLGFFGFVLCIVRWKTGSLYPGMALHSVNNCIALGANELHWGAGKIVALSLGALLTIALVTGPLSRGVIRSSN